jgi:hypothetical protein
MHLIEDRAIFLLGREGFYPKLGSLTVGSGFAYGAGFRIGSQGDQRDQGEEFWFTGRSGRSGRRPLVHREIREIREKTFGSQGDRGEGFGTR